MQKSLKAANNRPTHNKCGGANIQKGRKGLSLLVVMGSTLVMIQSIINIRTIFFDAWDRACEPRGCSEPRQMYHLEGGGNYRGKKMADRYVICYGRTQLRTRAHHIYGAMHMRCVCAVRQKRCFQ